MNFLRELLSKKLGFAVAVEALIQSLHTTAETKSMASAIVAVAYLVGQAYVDAHAPGTDPPPPEAKKETTP